MKGKNSFLLAWMLVFGVLSVCWSNPGLLAGQWRNVMEKNSQNEINFLNDRSRDITGITPLGSPGYIVPGGLTGENQVVAIADSGLDKGSTEDIHPDLKSSPGKKPKVVMLKSWAGREKADDPIGHGTHMAATIAGTGAASNGKYKGIAPGASIYFQGILDRRGKISLPPDLFKLFGPAYDAGVRVHVNAWGGSTGKYNTRAFVIDQFMYSHPDFLVVFGAGNSGPGKASLTAEANSKNALVVGASLSPRPSLDAAPPGTLNAADFSSRGPAQDGRIKPELLAPGTSIVSARAEGIEGNMTGFSAYTRMQGTSMAAAVTGGAVAVVRQYLQQEMNISNPSSALIKALLVNGARTGSNGPAAEGFGVLDPAGTVMALKEGDMLWQGEPRGLFTGQSYTTDYTVADTNRPLKVTFNWTDPVDAGTVNGVNTPGLTGSLVNRLHLEVKGPDGGIVYGNSFLTNGGPDNKNNVQQVYIKKPLPGQYVIRIYAGSVNPSLSPGGQQFALAYGQSLQTGTITGVASGGSEGFSATNGNTGSGTVFTISGGGTLITGDRNIELEINSIAQKGHILGYSEYLPGAQYYAGSRNIYITALVWRPPSVQLKKLEGGYIWTETSPAFREGGYYQSSSALVKVKGSTLGEGGINKIPPGVPAVISVNPITGQIWKVDTDYRIKEGTVISVSGQAGDRIITLAGDSTGYYLSGETTYLGLDSFIHTDPLDAAFGTLPAGDNESIIPGMQVEMVLDPLRNNIKTLIINRQMVAGRVLRIDRPGGKIMLDNGKSYDLFPGAAVYLHDMQASIDRLNSGDYILGVSLGGTDSLLTIFAYPEAIIGKIVYLNSRDGTISINGAGNIFATLPLDPGVKVTRWGQAGHLSALSAGDWVRIILSENGGLVKYISVGDRGDEVAGTVESVEQDRITLNDGSVWLAGNGAVYTREGLPVKKQDVSTGDNVSIIPLVSGQGQIIAEMKAFNRPGGRLPEINYTALPLDKFYVITGVSDAERIYVRRGAGDMAELTPGRNGEFTYSLIPAEQPEGITIIAVNTEHGAVTGRNIIIPARSDRQFSDVTGHWAEQVLARMAGRGIAVGYGDGTFKPDNYITREEMAVLLARCFGWSDSAGYRLKYGDRRQISSWAYSSVASLRQKGIMNGFADHSFRPGAPVTRVELATIVASVSRMLGIKTDQAAPAYNDGDDIPGWAKGAVERVSMDGILVGYPGNVFAPMESNTRAEVAAVLYRLLQLKEKTN